MSQYDNTNRGVLFKNEGDKKRERGPDYSGSLNVDGVEFFLDAWIKEAQSGRKFMSLSVKLKERQPAAPAPAPRPNAYAQAKGRPQPAADDFDSDIPW